MFPLTEVKAEDQDWGNTQRKVQLLTEETMLHEVIETLSLIHI